MSKVAHHYVGRHGAQYFEWQRQAGDWGALLDAEKFHRHVGPTDTVVDFGCGTGLMLTHLSAAERIAVEPNEHARANIAPGIHVVARTRELADSSADVVVSNHALEHTLDPADELRELRRVLKPGGRLVLWLPIDDWRTQRNSRMPDLNHHLFTWTPLLLSNLLTECGFRVQSVRVVTYAWPPKTGLLLKVLPRRVWDRLAWLSAVIWRRRQLEAICSR